VSTTLTSSPDTYRAPPIELPAPPVAMGLVDRLLRDRKGLTATILDGEHDQKLVSGLIRVSAVGAAAFGIAIGLPAGLGQVAVGAIKLPLVLLMATGLSLPVLHVACNQAGTRLRYSQLNALVLQALATGAITMAGLAPLITLGWLFFSLDAGGGIDQSWYAYRRVVIAGVAVAGAGGLVGFTRLWWALPIRALLPWSAAFALSALQLSWLLRPVVGMPGQDLVLVRALEDNGLGQFLKAVAAVLL
jgi:hypothetical protein